MRRLVYTQEKQTGKKLALLPQVATAEALVIRDGEGSSKITTLPDDALGASEFDIANRSYVQQKLAEMPGDLVYKGAWDASTNTPALSPAVPEESGDYYKVSVFRCVEWHEVGYRGLDYF